MNVRYFRLLFVCFVVSAVSLSACNDGSKEKAEAERIMKETQEMTAKTLENANKLIDSSKDLANEQLKQASEAMKNAGANASEQANKALTGAKEIIDEARKEMVYPTPPPDPSLRREAAAMQMKERMVVGGKGAGKGAGKGK